MGALCCPIDKWQWSRGQQQTCLALAAWHASISALLTQHQAAVVAAMLFDALNCHSFHLPLCRRGGCGQWQRRCGVETIPQEPPFCPAKWQRQHHRLHHSEICRPAPHSQVSHDSGSVIWPADMPVRVVPLSILLPATLRGPSYLGGKNMLLQTLHFDSCHFNNGSCRPCLRKLPQQPLQLLTPSLPLRAGALEQAGKSQLAAFLATSCGLLHIWALPPRSHFLAPLSQLVALLSAPFHAFWCYTITEQLYHP